MTNQLAYDDFIYIQRFITARNNRECIVTPIVVLIKFFISDYIFDFSCVFFASKNFNLIACNIEVFSYEKKLVVPNLE